MKCKWAGCGEKIEGKKTFCNYECYNEYRRDMKITKELKYMFGQKFGRPKLDKLKVVEKAKLRGVSLGTFYKMKKK